MVDLILNGIEGAFDVGEVEHPAEFGFDGATHVNRNAIAVPMSKGKSSSRRSQATKCNPAGVISKSK